MTDYISREAFKAEIRRLSTHYLNEWDTLGVLAAADRIPAADVRPVVRGKWKDAMQSCHDSPHVKCSVCGEYYWRYFKKFNFCPNCGADMREES